MWPERRGSFGRDLGGKINTARCLTELVGGRQMEVLRKTRDILASATGEMLSWETLEAREFD